MGEPPKLIYEFGPFHLVPSEREFRKEGVRISLEPKAFDILTVLVEKAGELVENRTMLERVWPGSFVEEANIQVQISKVRRIFSEAGVENLIETVPKIGYRFASDVKITPVSNSRTENGSPIAAGASAGSLEPRSDVTSGSRAFMQRRTVVAAALLVLVGAAGFLAYGLWAGTILKRPAVSFSGGVSVSRLTSTGTAFGAALSHDGKYVAYQAVSGGRHGIWLMKLDDRASVQIVPSAESPVNGLTFSPADDYLYYTQADSVQTNSSSVFRISRLGGEPHRVLAGVNSPIGFTPDGDRFAFVRSDPATKETAIFTAKRDGTGVRKLSSRTAPDSFAPGKRPAFSPDGSTIACVGIKGGERFQRVLSVEEATGSVTELTSENWPSIQDVVWSADGSSLLLLAQDDINFGPHQLWHFTLADGKAKKITNELNSYVGLSLGPEARTLVSTSMEGYSQLWLIETGNFPDSRQLASIKGGGRMDLSWMPDGRRIVYTSNSNGQPDVFMMNSDGTGITQLTSDSTLEHSLDVSRDGRFIVFVSNKSGPDQLWRMNSDGSDPRRLGSHRVYRYPTFSRDGRSVIYTTWSDNKANVWSVSIDGGEPQPLLRDFPFSPSIAPDQRSMAYLKKDEESGRPFVEIASFPEGRPISSFEVPANTQPGTVRWAPDSKSLIYRATSENHMNFWIRRPGEAESRRLTPFTEDPAFYCTPSPDMTRTVCLRSSFVRDIVLFTTQDQ